MKEKKSKKDEETKNSIWKRFFNWYGEHRKLVTGLLCYYELAHTSLFDNRGYKFKE